MEHAVYTVLIQSNNVTLTYLDLEAIFKHAAMSKVCLSGRACQGAWNEIFCEPQRAMKLNVELKSLKKTELSHQPNENAVDTAHGLSSFLVVSVKCVNESSSSFDD